ncbi:TetR/AcrR family transcriptional regulator [Saccharopolyspora flava]|uniref:Transcriptional regulator, TetR family n=1 Tax=Saccharopolyspora flava TaxID=95161 RepID=A0A1I6U716_9PSEU|nr:TetR/AcrR family transcriptional regulator [Saccharopolyspora flava]SFS97224.1 transcriptional regulator, TetR family [Saccharopolyspora flava]
MTGKYHHGDLRAELVRVALDLIAERGPDGFSVAEIARRAKVSPGAPYRHFPDRDSLVAAVATQVAHQLADEVEQAAGEHTDPVEGLAAAAGAYTGYLIRQRVGMDLINTEILQGPRYADLHDQTRRLTDQLLLRTMQVAAPADALELMEQLFTQAHGYGTFWLNGVFTKHGYTPALVVRKSAQAARLAVQGHLHTTP